MPWSCFCAQRALCFLPLAGWWPAVHIQAGCLTAGLHPLLPHPPLDGCSMEFVAEQALATTPIQKAYINHASAPFLPDIVAIDYNILLMDSQQRQARAKGAPSLLAPAGASSGANVAPQT